jgi:hypothetical protein
MAAQSITIKLTLPYPFRKEEIESIEAARKTPEGFCHELSEQFIARALTACHGSELDRKAARMFRGVKRELDKGEDTITLDGTLAEWFFDLFFSNKAEEQVKVRPEHAVWFFQWLDALEEARATLKAEAA